MSQDRQAFWGRERRAEALGWELGASWRCVRETENEGGQRVDVGGRMGWIYLEVIWLGLWVSGLPC